MYTDGYCTRGGSYTQKGNLTPKQYNNTGGGGAPPSPPLPSLCQDDIVESIRAGVERRLLAASASRTFTQMQLPFAPLIPGTASVPLTV